MTFHREQPDMTTKPIQEITVAIKGAGEMASGVAWRLYMANIRRIYMMEVAQPLAVRRLVSFCEAVYDKTQTVEAVPAALVADKVAIHKAWADDRIAVIVDPGWSTLEKIRPDVVVDAILAKKNLGTSVAEAQLVIGLGPGFRAGQDAHMVIETHRGHDLGRIITSGSAEPNTGVPGSIGGVTQKRVLRGPAAGEFMSNTTIGDLVKNGDVVGHVDGTEIRAEIDGVIRGLIRPGTQVDTGMKIGDIDPRGDPGYCPTISEKARAIGGSVLEAVLRGYLKPAEKNSAAADPGPRTAPAGGEVDKLTAEIQEGKPRTISRAVDLIESESAESHLLIGALWRLIGKAHRIGITGPPGAGKSTFTNQLVKLLRSRGQTVGIVAVDPSSPFSGGALLGDRLRMSDITGDPGVFIRSLATRGNPGGLARKASEVADVLDVSGKHIVIFETAGVGQVEIDIMSAADTVVVMTVPDAGDMVQSMKSGIMEIGDIFVVNKADLPGAERMKADIEAVLQMRASGSGWRPTVRTSDARKGAGLAEIHHDIQAHLSYLKKEGLLIQKKQQRAEERIRFLVNDSLTQRFWTNARLRKLRNSIRSAGDLISPHSLADELLSD
jgi:xanthine dehydrogenase accessory factor